MSSSEIRDFETVNVINRVYHPDHELFDRTKYYTYRVHETWSKRRNVETRMTTT